MSDALPVTVIGGYLGAGKTTLINRILRQAEGKRLAVLVNEFGELPIDEDLIEARDDDLISLAGGCICCSFGSDLAGALQRLGGLVPRPDHVIIEASGVAMPGAIAQSVALLTGLQIEGICVLVDSLHIRSHVKDDYIGDTVLRQLEQADLIVLTKADLLAQTDLSDLRNWITERQPATPQVISGQEGLPNDLLLGPYAPDLTSIPQEAHDQAYDSIVLIPPTPMDVRQLADQLTDPALGVLRAKGHLEDLSGDRLLIQLCGSRVDIATAAATGSMGLVCIGLRGQLSRPALHALFETLSSGSALSAT